MNQRIQSPVFWGSYSPLGTLVGAGLLVMASSRLAFAVFCAGALLWVYCLSALAFFAAKSIMPKRGKTIILLFLLGLVSSIYVLFGFLLNPLLTLSTWFFLVLIPPICIGSGIFEDLEGLELDESIPRVFLEALSLALLIIALSLIREPLGMGSLSFPGGPGGIVEFFSADNGEGFFPIRILSVSSGGLLLLGYMVALFRHYREGK
ncbi:hypothetical protein [Leadbettera azotonutricia]|uniref:Putative membrane protein n=1 Tax=Leadbettera azotonutricia (strain ATCC BAA-888 / DSM 13862 / ZAS-9) TaxID=545695 RepID=F5YDM9_LEAAZ|nr:hypothetical protein [Leadbettera azotonutricia]AEF80100.1 putative membrane protein [Leadbettera azotonutricia ZAS-9]